MKSARWIVFWIVALLWALGMLALAWVSGIQHDYVAYSEIWALISSGGDPWSTNNVYGPIFNAFSLVAQVNPLAPKITFAATLVAVTIAMGVEAMRSGGWNQPLSIVAWALLLPANYLVIGIAFVYGLNDGLVAALVGAAVLARFRHRSGLVGLFLGLAILLKFYPVLLLPFFVLDGRRLDFRILWTTFAVAAGGLVLSLLVWGGGIVTAWSWIGGRAPGMLALLAALERSPLPFVDPVAIRFLDATSIFLISAVVLATLSFVWWRHLSWIEGATIGLIAVLLVYKGGHPQQYLPWLILTAALLIKPSTRASVFAWMSLPFALFLSAFQLGYQFRTQDHFALIGLLPIDVGYAITILGVATLSAYVATSLLMPPRWEKARAQKAS